MDTRRLLDPLGVVFGILLPSAAAAAGLLLTIAWRDRLPGQIITHWSAAGPNDHASPCSAAWMFGLVIVLVGAGAGSPAALAGALLLMRRMMLIIGLTATGLLITLEVTMLAIQLDHQAHTAVALPTAAIPAGAVGGFLVGLFGASRLRDHRSRGSVHADPPRKPTPPIRDVVGFGRIGTGGFVVAACTAAVLGCLAADTAWPLGIALPAIVLVAGLMRFDVRIDETGVRVRNLGMVSIDIDADEIVGVELVEVNPFHDYGGWGLRATGRGRYGIVTRTGRAVRIETVSGLNLTITSDRAEAMAHSLDAR